MTIRTVAVCLGVWGWMAACQGDPGAGEGEIRGICVDLCDSFETCGLGSTACVGGCHDALAAAPVDDVEACSDELYGFSGGCAEFPSYMAGGGACARALSAGEVGRQTPEVPGASDCELVDCMPGSFAYSCGADSYSIEAHYCGNGSVSTASVTYPNGHSVHCDLDCGGGGSCEDDTGARCAF